MTKAFWLFETSLSNVVQGRQLSLRHFILLPVLYGLLAHGFKKYWLENDLRHLYKELIKPQHRRYRDDFQSDYRDIDVELAKKQDLSKSIVYQMEQASSGKLQKNQIDSQNFSTRQSDTTEHSLSSTSSNLNLIRRQ